MPAKILLNPRGREAQLSRQLLKELSEESAVLWGDYDKEILLIYQSMELRSGDNTTGMKDEIVPS